MKKLFLGVLILSIVVVSGCVDQKNTGIVLTNPFSQNNLSANPIIINTSNVSQSSDSIINMTLKENKCVLPIPQDGNILISNNSDTYFIRCSSHSMIPAFDCNDYLIGKQLTISEKSSLRNGTIIWFTTYGSQLPLDQLVHRIIYTGNDEVGLYYYTKGDNNTIRDQLKVRTSMIIFEITDIIKCD